MLAQTTPAPRVASGRSASYTEPEGLAGPHQGKRRERVSQADRTGWTCRSLKAECTGFPEPEEAEGPLQGSSQSAGHHTRHLGD